MFVWVFVLFILGILVFLDSMYSYGEIFRRVNSIFYMLISLGLLIRVSIKIKQRRIEGLLEKIERLKMQVRRLQRESWITRKHDIIADDTGIELEDYNNIIQYLESDKSETHDI
jgi:cytochrome c biogenesis protein CcdA